MYITEIEITDLRCFKGTQKLNLQRADGSYAGWTVFAGRNGSGKSTLLKAIALSVIGPLTARSLVSSFPSWVCKGQSEGSIAVKLEMDKETDKFQGGGNTAIYPFWVGLKWNSSPNSDSVKGWIDKNITNKRKAPERGPWADTPKGWMITGYGPYRHIGPMTIDVAQKKSVPLLSRLVSLFSESTLVDSIEWMKTIHAKALEGRTGQAQLLDAIVKLLSQGLLPDDSVVEKVDTEGLWIRRNGISLPLEQLSDGYKSIAAFVVDLTRHIHQMYGELSLITNNNTLQCPVSGVVLIDEIDAHLHPAWQQKIGFWLTSHFPNLQFLVTTHSPFVCQAASPQGVIRLPAPGESEPMRHVSDEWFTAIVNGSADDAVVSELFGLEHPHSERAEKLRKDVAMLERKILRKQATKADREAYITLKQQLPDDLAELADRVLRRGGE